MAVQQYSLATKLKKLDRRVQVAHHYLSGKGQPTIAKIIGVSQRTVSNDLALIRKEWMEKATLDFTEAVSEQLAKLDKLEIEYWEAWEKSKTELLTTDTMVEVVGAEEGGEEIVGAKRVSQHRMPREGNATFLAGVERCIAKRCELLGLNAPTKIVAATIVSGVPDDHVDRLLNEYYAKQYAIPAIAAQSNGHTTPQTEGGEGVSSGEGTLN